MKRWFTTFAVLSCMVASSGCGAPKDSGPADPSTTPQVNEADIQKSIESSMPADMKEKYGK